MTEPQGPLFSGVTRHPATPMQVATQLAHEAQTNGGRASRDGDLVVIDAPNDYEGSIGFRVEVMLEPAGDRTQIFVRRARPPVGEGAFVMLGAVAAIVLAIVVVVVASGNARGIAGLFSVIGLGVIVSVWAFNYWRGQAEEFAMRLVRHTIAIPWDHPVSG